MVDFEEEALRLRVYVGESDHRGGTALYKAVVHLLRERGVWGATALRGIYGYGKKSAIHAATPLRLSSDLPVVVEAVDKPEKIRAVARDVAAMVGDGLVTVERVTAITRVGDEARR